MLRAAQAEFGVTETDIMSLYLGIDGGGTKTESVIMDHSGTVLGSGLGGPGNVATTPEADLLISVRTSVRAAMDAAGLAQWSAFAAVNAAMAGISVASRREAFLRALQAEVQADRHTVVADYVAAYWGASQGEPGIVVIAGTGAVAFGRNAKGAVRKEDGLGYLLGDRGSGFDLGIRSLRYTLEQIRQGGTDRLTLDVLNYTGAQSEAQVLQWLYSGFNPHRVAGLAPAVGALAEQGEPAARWLVSQMALCLRHSVRQIRHSLELGRDVDVYPMGGLWNIGSFFMQQFVEPLWTGEGAFRCEPDSLPGGRFHVTEPRSGAAYGAALMARTGQPEG